MRKCLITKQNLIFVIMRSVLIFLLSALLSPVLWSQAGEPVINLIDYHPAPGQHINDSLTGTPAVALKMLSGSGSSLSLGAFGGYLVLGFNSSIENDPDNPYGVDFVIYGNASGNHSEPGIVKVMKDDNKNGFPDDTWYEIAGSAHYSGNLKKDYSITYFNPGQAYAADVSWSDNQGLSGKVFKNSFHSQPYYPLEEIFPGIPGDSMSFSGSELKSNVKISNGLYVSSPYVFGYADNLPVKNPDFSGIPDNPYTIDQTEGDGGDGIDISWAIDSEGNYADLPEIDFVMISTGVNETAGWLGEISTDITGFADVAPDRNIHGQQKIILGSNIPGKLILKDSIVLKAEVLFSGRKVNDEKVSWESLNPEILKINGSRVFPVETGEALLRCSMDSDPGVFALFNISVVNPESLVLETNKITIQSGEVSLVNFSFIDKSDEKLIGLVPDLIIENTGVAEILKIEDNYLSILGKSAGTAFLKLTCPGFSNISGTIEICVIEKIEPVHIRFSASNQDKTILPSKDYTVMKADVMSLTDRYQKKNFEERNYITLADAIATVFKNEGLDDAGYSLAFRQDEFGGDGLYVWQVGYNYEYQYGWGGYQSDDLYAKTWFVIVNEMVFASGFDSVKVFDGDRISLVNIDNSREAWSFSRIIPPTGKIRSGERVGFHSEQLDIFPTGKGEYIVSGPFPLVNSEVLIDQSLINSAESDLASSFSGDFYLNFSKGGTHRLALEKSEALFVEVSYPLTTADAELFSIYPNPCQDWVRVVNPINNPFVLCIYSMDGGLKIKRMFYTPTSSVTLDLRQLEKGLYLLEIISETQSVKQKILKL